MGASGASAIHEQVLEDFRVYSHHAIIIQRGHERGHGDMVRQPMYIALGKWSNSCGLCGVVGPRTSVMAVRYNPVK